MTKLMLALTFSGLLIPTTFEIPYGVQDPIMGSAGFKNCEGGEVGYWNVIQRSSSDKKRTAIYMIITTHDIVDPAYIVCVVPPKAQIVVMDGGQPT